MVNAGCVICHSPIRDSSMVSGVRVKGGAVRASCPVRSLDITDNVRLCPSAATNSAQATLWLTVTLFKSS